MSGLIAGAISTILLLVATILWIVPGVFGFVQGLFQAHDIGTLVGIVAAFIIGALCVQVSIAIGIFVGAFVNAGK